MHQQAINVQKAHPEWTVAPEIMIPLSCDAKELKYVKDIVVATADAEIAAAGSDMKYEVGTMIEIPRAALTAGDIAKEAEFFCFGTNDLTQMTYGFSRDDAGKFLTLTMTLKSLKATHLQSSTRQVLASLWKWLLRMVRLPVLHSTAASAVSTAVTHLQ